jgi:hypothetical protein
MDIWWYLEYLSKKDYSSCPIIVFNTSFVKGNGYLLVVAFRFPKSTQIMNLPFFFGTTTIGDNQLASSMGYINHVANNLFISCLTTTT